MPEPLLRANQMYVERFLLEHIRTRPNIQLRFGWRVSGFEQDADGVRLIAVESASGEALEHWRADYLVGCDGGQSFVRRTLGIGYLGPDGSSGGFLSGRMFSSHVRVPALHRDILPDRKAWMYNVVAPDARMLLISLDGEDEFLLMTQARSHDEMPQDDRVIAAIRQGVGADVEVEVLAHAVWHGGLALVAERFSDRRVFLAGDATHLFSPTGGFGMNTGTTAPPTSPGNWPPPSRAGPGRAAGVLRAGAAPGHPAQHRSRAPAHPARGQGGGARRRRGPGHRGRPGTRAARRRCAASGAVHLHRRRTRRPLRRLPIVWQQGQPPADDPLHYRPSTVPGGRLPHLWLPAGDGTRRSVFDLLGAGSPCSGSGPMRPRWSACARPPRPGASR